MALLMKERNLIEMKRYNRNSIKTIQIANKIAEFTGETINPFKHRVHRTKKGWIDNQFSKVKLYKQKKEILKIKEIEKDYVNK
jgi:hypothetical protein